MPIYVIHHLSLLIRIGNLSIRFVDLELLGNLIDYWNDFKEDREN